jgi:autotransporter passenger strand-loop-strand repeat protein
MTDTVVSSGQTSSGIVLGTGDTLTVLSGGTASATMISSGGVSVISAGGVASTTIDSGGEDVFGIASGTTVGLGGSQTVFAGGVADAATVDSGGLQTISSGGLASGTVINSGGGEVVSSAGVASATALNSGGSATILFGGIASGTAINDGASVTILSGGSAGGTAVNSGGSEIISAGGSDVNGAINGGSQDVFGVASGIAINGGTQTIESGGSGGGDTINSGGAAAVRSGGSASATVINSGGSETVSTGGIDQDATLNGGFQQVFGTASATTINAGSQTVGSGGVASATRINSGASETILSGGSVVSALISGGSQQVSGVASAVKIDDGTQTVGSGGVASGTVVNSTGSESISGGVAQSTTINAGGSATVLRGGLANATTINSGGNLTVSADGLVSATTVNSSGGVTILSGGSASGVTINAGGFVTVSSGGTTDSALIRGSDSLLVLLSGAVVSNEVAFAGSGGTLAIGANGSNGYVVSGFVTGDIVDLTNLPFDSGGTATLAANNVLNVVEQSGSATLNLDPAQNFDGFVFGLTADSTGSGTVVAEEVCFCRGTLILTEQGERPIEELQVGDRVKTLAGNYRPVVWIGYGRTLVTRANRMARPIVVCQGALADGVPGRDLYLTHGHALYLEGVLIPVEHLVNHRSIRWADQIRAVEYYHLEFPAHEVVFANGAPAESYYEARNRAWFQNTRPGSAAGAAKPTFAPVLTAGEIVENVWARLFERAGGQIMRETTDDPDLHLLADGVRLDPAAAAEGTFVFTLARPPASLLLRSRSGVPSLLGESRADHRTLGVAIREIILDQTGIATALGYDAPQLREGGCHSPEDGFAWTDGEFALPPRFFAGLAGAFRLIVHTQPHGMHYPLAEPAETGQRRSSSAA